MLETLKMYANLPLIPRESFFRIGSIAVLNYKKDHILTYGMFNRIYPHLYPPKPCHGLLVSPVMILSSYNNIYRIPDDDWSRFDTINKDCFEFPIFVDTNGDWIKHLEESTDILK